MEELEVREAGRDFPGTGILIYRAYLPGPASQAFSSYPRYPCGTVFTLSEYTKSEAQNPYLAPMAG